MNTLPNEILALILNKIYRFSLLKIIRNNREIYNLKNYAKITFPKNKENENLGKKYHCIATEYRFGKHYKCAGNKTGVYRGKKMLKYYHLALSFEWASSAYELSRLYLQGNNEMQIPIDYKLAFYHAELGMNFFPELSENGSAHIDLCKSCKKVVENTILMKYNHFKDIKNSINIGKRKKDKNV